MALTKKQEQELRAAEAEEARIAKLQEELEAAQARKQARAAKRVAEHQAAIERKQALIESKRSTLDKITHDLVALQADIERLEGLIAAEEDVD